MTTQLITQANFFERSKEEEQDVRVQDFLNDKLQTSADLDGIDALLEDVRKQQLLLKEQVPIFIHLEDQR